MAKFKECAKVVSQERIGTGIFSLWLQTEQVAGEAKTGTVYAIFTVRMAAVCSRDPSASVK